MTDKPKTVFKMISEVMAILAKDGISKDRKNTQQGYNFRGIDDVYNALAPAMSSVGLVVLPRVLSREVKERAGKNGGALFYTTVECEFDFVSSQDGSMHTVKTYGEAMDSGDKSTNKAMSAAYKYACMQAFCIPTEGDNDADATTHEVKPEAKPEPKKEEKSPLSIRADEINLALKNSTNVKNIDLTWNNNQKDLLAIKEMSAKAYAALDKNYLSCRDRLLKEEIEKDDIPDFTNTIMAG